MRFQLAVLFLFWRFLPGIVLFCYPARGPVVAQMLQFLAGVQLSLCMLPALSVTLGSGISEYYVYRNQAFLVGFLAGALLLMLDIVL